MLWICLALLTAAVILALARPLMRTSEGTGGAAEADMAVYRDQLTEIENDRERGLIGDIEAEAARAEVARRLIHLGKPAALAQGRRGQNKIGTESAAISSPRLLQGAFAMIPLASMALYLWIGSPGLPGQPLASRKAAPTAATPVDELIARVEAELKKNPNDPRGWGVIAPVYMQMKRYADASYAFSQTLRLKGEAVEPLMGFAEAELLANQGVVNDGVKRAAERLLVLKPDRIEPKIWQVLGKEQDGDTAGALAGYKALIASAPAGAPWVAALTQQMQRLEQAAASSTAPGPSASGAPPMSADPSMSGAMAGAIAAMEPEDQQKQITAMVDRLAKKLEVNGNDLGGWQRLVRAYQVMGRKEDAVAALASARKHFAAEPKALEDLDGLARSLGL
jgi:cytochrome c-type biogenesis protein CcmH